MISPIMLTGLAVYSFNCAKVISLQSTFVVISSRKATEFCQMCALHLKR